MSTNEEISALDKCLGVVASAVFWTVINSLCMLLKVSYRLKATNKVRISEKEQRDVRTEAAKLADIEFTTSNQSHTRW